MKMVQPRGTVVDVEERNEYDTPVNDSSRYVSPEEACKDLVNAIVLQGVLDYRDAIWDGVRKNGDQYYIQRNDTIEECEHFFKDTNFKLYKKLPDQILEFYRIFDNLPDETVINKSKNAFKCPICNHEVEVRYVKVPSRNLMNAHAKAKKAYCPSCLMKGLIVTPISKEERSAS